MKPTRFERKILAAIVAVAIVPLVGALVLGQLVLSEAYTVGVNSRVRGELERGLELYRTHFSVLKESANHSVDAIASEIEPIVAAGADPSAALGELLGSHTNVARVRVSADGGDELAFVERPERAPPSARLLELERSIEGGHVVATVGADPQLFADYLRAGELVEVFGRLERGSGVVSGFYLAVYMGFLLSVIVAALGVGIVLSRRVTRRVALLAEATARVGTGDLTVQVPSEVDDEVGELTRSFNAMVRDLHSSRDRIEYLQRIGAWQDFARRLAHEIKNPLTPIQLAVQEVHRSYQGEDPAFRKRLDESLGIVQEEVATLRRLVGEFSAFARLPQVHLEPADLGEFAADAHRTLAAIADEQSGVPVGVELVAADEPLPVQLDAMMFKRCLDNLVRNGIDAIRGRSEPKAGKVVMRLSRRDDRAILEVADDGPGISHAARLQVFDPYYTTKADGTGLGLAIVKKLILDHGGDIACADSDLGGVSFTISLPLRLADR